MVSASTLSAADVTHYQEHGWLVLDSAVDDARLTAARDDLSRRRTDGAVSSSVRYNPQGRIDFQKIPNMARASAPFRALACAPPVVAAVETLLAQSSLLFRDVVVVKPARDGAALDYHQDSQYWDVRPRELISAWIPLRDVGTADGCLRVIDGSHRRDYRHDLQVGDGHALPHWMTLSMRRLASLGGTGDSDAAGFVAMRRLKNAVLGGFTRYLPLLGQLQELHARVPSIEKARAIDLPLPAGSVILFHSMLLHASAPNRSDHERPAYIASYMGAEFVYQGVGQPELLVASEGARPVYVKPRIARP